MKRILSAVAVSFAFAAGTSAVLAQSAENATEAPSIIAQSSAPAAQGAGPRAGAPAREQHRSPSERVEARLAYARSALKITDAQQPQWDTFANVMRKHAQAMDQRMQQFRAQRGSGNADAKGGERNVSAIARLERAQQRTAERAARLNELLTAAKPLYASLTPEQKQVADQMLARHGHGRGHGGHRHRDHGMQRGAA